jgi:hypothetical protein
MSPIPKGPAPNGRRWNTWAAVPSGVPRSQTGICCYPYTFLGVRGHGGQSGYLMAAGLGADVGLSCCERHGKSTAAAQQGLTWQL